MTKLKRGAADEWLKQNDPDLVRAADRPRRHPHQRLARPYLSKADRREIRFKRETDHLMSLPDGSHWEPHPKGEGFIVYVPGKEPYWLRNGQVAGTIK